MSQAGFLNRLLDISRRNNSLLCVGLDPDPKRLAVADVFTFNKAVIDATADLVCAYKPNLAFYEALGLAGIEALKATVDYVPDAIPVIGDAKRGDVGNTAQAYARALFDFFDFDAVTVNPYLGFDSVAPFLEYPGRGVFVLCRTSNPGAADFQDLACGEQRRPLYELVAEGARERNQSGDLGLVVGATYPQELARVRQLCPGMMLLIPGVGAQGGDLEATVRHGVDTQGERAIINSSRQIIYASSGVDFALAARRAALELRFQINKFRAPPAA